MRLPSLGLVMECLVPGALEQRVTGREARASYRWLLRRFGEPAPGPAPAGMRVMPPPSVWKRIPSWEWHRANVDPVRARTIIAAAEVAHRLEESLSLDRSVRLQRLRAVPGVGVADAAEISRPPLEPGRHPDAGHVADDAGPGDQAGEHAGEEGRVLLQHLVAREIGAGDIALRDHEADVGEFSGDRLGRGIVLAAMGDDQGTNGREAGQRAQGQYSPIHC